MNVPYSSGVDPQERRVVRVVYRAQGWKPRILTYSETNDYFLGMALLAKSVFGEGWQKSLTLYVDTYIRTIVADGYDTVILNNGNTSPWNPIEDSYIIAEGRGQETPIGLSWDDKVIAIAKQKGRIPKNVSMPYTALLSDTIVAQFSTISFVSGALKVIEIIGRGELSEIMQNDILIEV